MRIEITNLAPVNSGKDNVTYIATSKEECRDSIDKMVYELLAQDMGDCDLITIGQVIGRIVG